MKQNFEAEADNEYVILGNSAIMKCEIPSFVADFVQVEMWMDSIGNNYYPGVDALGLQVLNANFSQLSHIRFIFQVYLYIIYQMHF